MFDSDGVKIYFHHVIPAPPPKKNATKQLCLKVCEMIINEINNGKGQRKDQRINHAISKPMCWRTIYLDRCQNCTKETMKKCEKLDKATNL